MFQPEYALPSRGLDGDAVCDARSARNESGLGELRRRHLIAGAGRDGRSIEHHAAAGGARVAVVDKIGQRVPVPVAGAEQAGDVERLRRGSPSPWPYWLPRPGRD